MILRRLQARIPPGALMERHFRSPPPPRSTSQSYMTRHPLVTGKLPTWDGTRFDLAWAIDVLYRGPVVPKNLDRKKEEAVGALPV